MKRSILGSVLALAVLSVLSPRPAAAKQFTLFGNPLNVFAFVSQSLQVSLLGDDFFVEAGLQQALLTRLTIPDGRTYRERLPRGLLFADSAGKTQEHPRSHGKIPGDRFRFSR